MAAIIPKLSKQGQMLQKNQELGNKIKWNAKNAILFTTGNNHELRPDCLVEWKVPRVNACQTEIPGKLSHIPLVLQSNFSAFLTPITSSIFSVLYNESWFNEMPWDWENVFVIQVFLHLLSYCGCLWQGWRMSFVIIIMNGSLLRSFTAISNITCLWTLSPKGRAIVLFCFLKGWGIGW